MLKLISVGLLLLWSVGCAGHYNAQMTKLMTPFVGKPITQVTDAWGPPATVYDEAPYKVYVWRSTQTSGGGSYSQQIPTGTRDSAGNMQTKTVVHGGPVTTVTTYKMFWVAPDGTCAKYKFGQQ